MLTTVAPLRLMADSARVSAMDVSMLPSRVSPIFIETICAPGATPSSARAPGWCAATMLATCVPWLPASVTMETTSPSSYTLMA